MKKFLMIAALVAAPAALAEETSYSYFDATYQLGGDMEFGGGGGSIDSDGYDLDLSFAVNDSMFVVFNYTTTGTDPSVFDINTMSLAAGWHGERFFAKLGWQSDEFDACAIVAPPCTVDDSGYVLDLGLRTIVRDRLELNAHVGVSDTGDLGQSTNFGVGAVLMVAEDIGVSFNYDLRQVSELGGAGGFDLDVTSYGLGFRFNF
jgi:hypothetical protein